MNSVFQNEGWGEKNFSKKIGVESEYCDYKERLYYKGTDLSMNGVQLHSHVPTHTSIYLDVLFSHVCLLWRVSCMPTLQQVSSVILLQIIHLQVRAEFSFVEIRCIIWYLVVIYYIVFGSKHRFSHDSMSFFPALTFSYQYPISC